MTSTNEVAIIAAVLGAVATITSAAIASILYCRSSCHEKQHCCELRMHRKSGDGPQTPDAADHRPTDLQLVCDKRIII